MTEGERVYEAEGEREYETEGESESMRQRGGERV